MAKKRISRVQAVLNTDIQKMEKMERAELAREISIVVSAANKRIRRLQKAGYNTPALQYTMKHGGMFSVKGKSSEALLNELKRAKGFMGAKTSSVRGAKKSIKTMTEMQKKINPDFRGEMTQEEIAKYWEAIDRIRELQPSTFNEICLQYTAQIEKYIESGRTANQAASYINRAINKAEAEQMKRQSELDKQMRSFGTIGENALNGNNL